MRLLVACLALGALGCAEDVSLTDGSASLDGGTTRMDGAVVEDDGGTTRRDGSVAVPVDATAEFDAATSGAILCQSHLYQCGNTLDDDEDGLIDDEDPDCLGPCQNNEAGFYLNIPGGDSAPCKLDCYFDQDQGSGNDHCAWDHRCDPLEPDWDNACAYRDPPPPSADCPDVQHDECDDVCGPLVPNGCDCFGCCNLPAGGDRWVFIGSVDEDGVPTCSLDVQESDESCHPCTPVANCLNTCAECEICIGRPELPEGCIPPSTDGGTVDGGIPVPMCDDGAQACGSPGLPSCPAGEFCLTGCCRFFG